MNYQVVLKAYGNDAKLAKACIAPERAVKDSDRASFSMTASDKCLKFEVCAKDPVALRATLNSITKMLTVFDKTKKIVGENG